GLVKAIATTDMDFWQKVIPLRCTGWWRSRVFYGLTFRLSRQMHVPTLGTPRYTACWRHSGRTAPDGSHRKRRSARVVLQKKDASRAGATATAVSLTSACGWESYPNPSSCLLAADHASPPEGALPSSPSASPA